VNAVSYAAPGVTAVFNRVRVVSTVAAIKSVSPTSTVLQNELCSAAELSAVPNAFKLLFLFGVWFFLRALFCCRECCSSYECCSQCCFGYVSAASALSMVPVPRRLFFTALQ
jgi:hypothetical protein